MSVQAVISVTSAAITSAQIIGRAEALAGFMRRVGICEERGSGVDQAVLHAEIVQLPAPDFRVAGESTVATLFGPRDLHQMSRAERVRAVYWHATLRFVTNREVTNTTIRERFGVDEPSKASRIISEAIEEGVIVAKDPNAGRRYMQYMPYWAA